LSLQLYLDDSSFSWRLRDILQQHGHNVVTPLDANLLGADDAQHFAYARQHDLILVTANPADFRRLHDRDARHAGIFAVYQDNDPRDMTYEEMARAMQNLIDAAVPIDGQFHVLNVWRY
jgi:hypothetical protein